MKGALSGRDGLIHAGVRNLHAYGYPSCNTTNILTDMIYKAFFISMLRDNLGKGADKDINSLLVELEKKTTPVKARKAQVDSGKKEE